jgi:hypothetical protein
VFFDRAQVGWLPHADLVTLLLAQDDEVCALPLSNIHMHTYTCTCTQIHRHTQCPYL